MYDKTDARECMEDHFPDDTELVWAGVVECKVRINCNNEDCGPHEVVYRDEDWGYE